MTSPTSFTWFGSRSRPLPRAVVAALPPATRAQYLVDALQARAVPIVLQPGKARPDAAVHEDVPARPDDAFVEALSAANTGREAGSRDGGLRRGARRSSASARDGLRVRARPSDCRAADGRCAPGTPVSLRRPKELAASSPGFYIALGDADLALGRDDVEVRVYFNVTAAGAAPLVATCTRLLNDARIPFSLKVLDHPTGYIRCDAAVLYLEDGRLRAGARTRWRRSCRRARPTCATSRRPSRSRSPPASPSASIAAASARASAPAAAGWSPRASSRRTRRGERPSLRSPRCRRPPVRGPRPRHRRPVSGPGLQRALCALTSPRSLELAGRLGARDRGVGDLVRRPLQLGRRASARRVPHARESGAWRRSVLTSTEERAAWRCSSPRPASRLDDDACGRPHWARSDSRSTTPTGSTRRCGTACTAARSGSRTPRPGSPGCWRPRTSSRAREAARGLAPERHPLADPRI